MRVEEDRLVLASFHQQVRNLIVFEGRLHNADHRHSFKIKLAHRVGRGIELRLAAVDHDQVRQRFAFIQQPPVTTHDRLAH